MLLLSLRRDGQLSTTAAAALSVLNKPQVVEKYKLLGNRWTITEDKRDAPSAIELARKELGGESSLSTGQWLRQLADALDEPAEERPWYKSKVVLAIVSLAAFFVGFHVLLLVRVLQKVHIADNRVLLYPDRWTWHGRRSRCLCHRSAQAQRTRHRLRPRSRTRIDREVTVRREERLILEHRVARPIRATCTRPERKRLRSQSHCGTGMAELGVLPCRVRSARVRSRDAMISGECVPACDRAWALSVAATSEIMYTKLLNVPMCLSLLRYVCNQTNIFAT